MRRISALQNVLGGRLAFVPTWRVLARRFARADRQLALRCLDAVGHIRGGPNQRPCAYLPRLVANDHARLSRDDEIKFVRPAVQVNLL